MAKHPWSAAEDMLAFLTAGRAGSDRAYRRGCASLCRLLGRVPDLTGTQHDPEGESVALVERRTVTNGSAKSTPNPDLMPLADAVFTGRRHGGPLTWGERVKLLQPHHRHGLTTGRHRTDADLCVLLDRHPDDQKVAAYLRRLQGVTRSRADAEEHGAPHVWPVDLNGLMAVRRAVTDPWLAAPDARTWAAVLDHVETGHVPDVPTLEGDGPPVIASGPTPNHLINRDLPVDDDGLPEEHVPTACRPRAVASRELAFAVGAETEPGSYGMFGGPWPTLAEAFEYAPPRDRFDRRVFLFRFNPDGTDERLYLWDRARWARFRE